MSGMGNDERDNVLEGTEEFRQALLAARHDWRLSRTFDTGATRDTEDGKFDYEGFLSPLALERFAAYMHKHRLQKDGSLRDSDNWQKGMPKDVYMKSMWRHFMDVWKAHRGLPAHDLEESLCALLFNVQGYLHELQAAKVPEPHRVVPDGI